MSTKDEVESTIIKENSGRFRLECLYSLLEGDICSQLGMSGERVLANEILSNQENLDQHPEIKEVLSMFKTGRSEKIDVSITIEKWIEH